ncbi:MAG: M28 family peptidase [Chitinophagales bacterium]
MRSSFLIIALIAFSATFSFAQNEDPSVKYANTIRAEELKVHLTFLANKCEGRETGKPGIIKAANYILDQFGKNGLTEVYEYPGAKYGFARQQEYPLIEFGWNTASIATKKDIFILMQDFYGYAGANNSSNFTADDIVFLGYGIDDSVYSDYKNVNVKGKVVIVAGGEPSANGISLLTKTEEMSKWTTDWRKKVNAATENGVKCLLMIDSNTEAVLADKQWRSFLEGTLLKLKSEYKEPEYCNSFFISQSMAEKLLGKKKKFLGKYIDKIDQTFLPASFSAPATLVININKLEKEVFASNVLGFVEGTDLKDEVVIVSAHYDHLGIRDSVVYNGADDDGSGTVAILEIAEAILEAKINGEGPRRSVLFVAFSGEEKGLLGSKSYVEQPAFPLANTVADLNIDMIGRVDEKHKDDSNYIYIIGSDFLSTQLHSINEAAAKNYTDLDLDYTFNSTTDPNRFYYRSDHYNFAKNNIPVIFYFNGTHADYHAPTDDVEKINFGLLEERTKLVFHTLWILANQDARIKVDVIQE